MGGGAVNYAPDTDNVIRRAPLLFAYDGHVIPTLMTEALRVAQGASSYIVKSSGASGEPGFGEQTGVVAVKIGSFEVPTDAQGAMILHDTGHVPERFVSAWEVLEPDFDANNPRGARAQAAPTDRVPRHSLLHSRRRGPRPGAARPAVRARRA